MNLIKIGDLIESGEASLQTGPFGTQLKASEYVNEGVPVINVRNIGYGSVIDEKLEYVNNKTAERLKIHVLRQNDIVFGRKGAVDRHALIDHKANGWIQGSDCLRLRLKAPDINNKFVSYYFCTQAHKEWMEAQGSFGATMSSLNQDIIKRISLPQTSLTIQKKIAAILSTYDDLIENNKRRIDILEKIAEEIFNEWFVRLRFPGHGQEKIIKGIPIGWPIKKVIEIINRHGFGRIYREKELAQTGQIVVIDQSEKKALGYYNGEPEHRASLRIPIILFGDHSCKMQIMTNPFSLAENVIPFRAKDGLSTIFLYYLTKNLIKTTEYKRHWTEFIHKEIILPPIKLQNEFSKIAMYHIQLGEMLESVNDNLQYSRNLLLLRLLSGKLSVEDLDIQFPKSMEDDYAEFHQ